jgi:hypothetical protein
MPERHASPGLKEEGDVGLSYPKIILGTSPYGYLESQREVPGIPSVKLI